MKLKTPPLFLIAALLNCVMLFGQVRPQTGTADYNIPMYAYSDRFNRLATDIGLVYKDGNGLKVNEISSSVGTGWDLSAGGYIRRIQNGEPDDQENYDSYTYPFLPMSDPYSEFWMWAKDYYPDGFLRSTFSSSDVIMNEGIYTPMYGRPYKYYKPKQKYNDDREQDFFEFNFNGRTGLFLISRPVGGVSTIRTMYDSKLKIEKVDGDLNNNLHIRTTISKFIITDEAGIKYHFEEADLDQIVDYETASEYSAYTPSTSYNTVVYINENIPEPALRITKGTTRNSFAKNQWHLTKIENPLTNTSIIFQYETYTVDINTQKTIQRAMGPNSDQTSVTQGRSVSQMKRLVKIILNTNETIDFQYSASYRVDVPTDKTLDRISIKYAGVEKLRWNFDYGYFVKNDIKAPNYSFTTEDKTWARLCLLNVSKTGGGVSEPPYTFDYYRGNENSMNSAVPAMFSSQQNLGGYYSTLNFGFFNPSNQTTSTSNPVYEPNSGDALPRAYYKSIVQGLAYNPTANFLTGAILGPTIEARNGILKKVKNPMGGEFSWEYEMNQAGPFPNDFYGVRVSKTIVYDGINHANDKTTEYKYVNANNTCSAWGAESYNNSFTTNVGNRGGCSGGERPLNQIYSVAKPIINFVLISAGIIPGVIEVVSLGGTMVPAFAIQYFGMILFNILSDIFSNPPEPSYAVSTMTVNINQPVNFNLLPYQYKRVEIIDKQGASTNGKTVQEFTSPDSGPSYAIDYPTVAKPYSSKQRYALWLYGLPETVTVYDKNNNPVKKVVNHYTPYKTVLNTEPYKSQKWIALQNDYGCGFLALTADLSSSNKISSETYFPMVGRIELASTDETTYNSANETSVTTTNFEYSTDNYMVKKITTSNSKGEANDLYTWYPTDYTLSGANQTMINNNIIGLPIATQSVVTRGGNSYAYDGEVTEFGVLPNGDVAPVKNYSLESVNPVLKSAVNFSAGTLVPSTTYYKEQQQINYLSNGLPKEMITAGKKSGKLFGYSNKLVIADVINGSADQAFFDSFEEGGIWTSEVGYDNSKVHNGKKAGRIDNLNVGPKTATGKTIDLALTQNTKFKFSGWVWSDHPECEIILYTQVGNNTPVWATYANTFTRNQWVFLENEFVVPSNVTKIFLKIFNRGAWDLADYGGTVWFDDIRLHPSDARMNTYTHDPLIGVLSRTDVNNRSIQYQYDGLGRISQLLDNEGNIIKKYCYNYAGQPESCPVGAFGNDVRTRVFQKNDCNTVGGFYGSQITYTVPANKYFGLSTTFANNLAEAEIDREGQAYANLNGTCIAGQPNDAASQNFTRSCTGGKVGTVVTYTVPFGKYAAATKPDANALAAADITANGQAYANANGYCFYVNTAINGNYYSQTCGPNQTPVAYNSIVAAGIYWSSYSQENANYQAQNDAQQQANANGTCTSGSVQVYARLEVSPSYSSNTSQPYGTNGTEYNYSQQVGIWLRFYSDAACNQPYAITSNINYSIDNAGYFETESSYTSHSWNVAFQGTATAGTTEIFFDDLLPFEGLWGGMEDGEWVWLEKWVDDWRLGSIGGGAIIATPIYPNHANGF